MAARNTQAPYLSVEHKDIEFVEHLAATYHETMMTTMTYTHGWGSFIGVQMSSPSVEVTKYQ